MSTNKIREPERREREIHSHLNVVNDWVPQQKHTESDRTLTKHQQKRLRYPHRSLHKKRKHGRNR